MFQSAPWKSTRFIGASWQYTWNTFPRYTRNTVGIHHKYNFDVSNVSLLWGLIIGDVADRIGVNLDSWTTGHKRPCFYGVFWCLVVSMQGLCWGGEGRVGWVVTGHAMGIGYFCRQKTLSSYPEFSRLFTKSSVGGQEKVVNFDRSFKGLCEPHLPPMKLGILHV